ncbi:MAG: LamG domain-containing protein [bacterium]
MSRTKTALFAVGLAALGCSAEFGGRCETAADCDEGEICLQSYCLPPEAQGPDDGVPDDAAPPDDGGGPADGEPDGGLDLDVDLGPDATPTAPLCAPGADGIPAYDPAYGHRACPDAHTIALWRLDTDFAALGRDGAPGPALDRDPDGDAVQLVAPGVGDGSARFTGQRDPRFLVADSDPLRDELPLTLELWVLIEGFQGADRSLAGNLDSTGRGRGGWELFVRAIDGQRYVFGAGVPGFGEDVTLDLVADDRVVAPNTWVHVALVGPGSGEPVQIYVDGVASERSTGALIGDGEAFRLGARRDTDTHYFQGRLDEVRLSDVARSAEDLAAAAANRPR